MGIRSQIRKRGKIAFNLFLIYIHPFPPLLPQFFMCLSSTLQTKEILRYKKYWGVFPLHPSYANDICHCLSQTDCDICFGVCTGIILCVNLANIGYVCPVCHTILHWFCYSSLYILYFCALHSVCVVTQHLLWSVNCCHVYLELIV